MDNGGLSAADVALLNNDGMGGNGWGGMIWLFAILALMGGDFGGFGANPGNANAIQADVTYITAYITRPATEQTLHEAEALLRDKIQWVAFTSATEAQVYKRLSHNTKPALACFGPYTAHCVRKEGLNVRFTSPDYSSFSAFAKHLKEFILSASEKA